VTELAGLKIDLFDAIAHESPRLIPIDGKAAHDIIWTEAPFFNLFFR